jgi:hypothetical protein
MILVCLGGALSMNEIKLAECVALWLQELLLCLPSQHFRLLRSYNESSCIYSFPRENIMGKTLHNRIYLGRSSALGSKRIQAALVVAAFASMGLVWLALQAIK